MNLANLSHNELLARCAWCHKRIPEDHECFGAGARMRPEAKRLLSGHEGNLLPIALSSGREVIVAIPTAESDARAAGHDVYFQTCSELCCRELSDALKKELSQGTS